MAEDKKKKMAVFEQEKNSFIGEIPKEGKNGKKKKSVAYQPRDADTTSGQNVQRSESTVKYQKTDTSGQNVQKSEGAEAGDKSGSDFIQPDSTFTEETEEKHSGDDYRRRDTYHQSQKKGRYQIIVNMTDTFINDTFLIIFQTVLSSGNQITQGNDKIGFQLQRFFIPLMRKLYIHRI